MKKTMLTSALAFLVVMLVNAGLKPGDMAVGFTLKNIDGTSVSLADYSDRKGVILVFTCNPCPYANAYEQRIIALHKKYAGKGFPVVAIDPNDDEISPEDSFAKMKEKAEKKGYPFPYLKDDTQEVYKTYGATNTPHVYVLQNNGETFKVAYVGAIDDNAMDEGSVTKKYVEKAITALLSGSDPDPSSTKAIGCSIKTKS
jgi:peroxiredoxin